MASAMIWPMSLSELAEIEPTCAISLDVVHGLDCAANDSIATATAWSIPRFKSIGFQPAATDFIPSRMIACARTVAVVVPSPATSAVLEATSLTN